jgi:hypothetical protein
MSTLLRSAVSGLALEHQPEAGRLAQTRDLALQVGAQCGVWDLFQQIVDARHAARSYEAEP